MLRSSNPILSKQDAFTPAAPQQYGQNPYAQQSYAQNAPAAAGSRPAAGRHRARG